MAEPPSRASAVEAVQLGPFHAPQISEAQRRFWLIVDAMLAALVVVAIIGGWAYSHMRASLRDVRSAGLASLLEAESRALQLWIDEKKRDAERWASTPAVQREAAALALLAGTGKVCAPVPQRALRDEIAPYSAVEEVSAFNLIARDGRIISSPNSQYCGLVVSQGFLRGTAPVFEGRTVFVRPWEERERVGEIGVGVFDGPLVWVQTPVRAKDGTVAAALGFGRVAAERFAKLLVLTGAGTSRDAYAFDEGGRMATFSRYGAELARAGAIDASQAAPWGWRCATPAATCSRGFDRLRRRPSGRSPSSRARRSSVRRAPRAWCSSPTATTAARR